MILMYIRLIIISSQDKVWITTELKRMHRLKSREYIKRGKSEKYKTLSKQFEIQFKLEAEKYMRKNIDELKETDPGHAYRILKIMGAQPGYYSETNTYLNISRKSVNNFHP